MKTGYNEGKMDFIQKLQSGLQNIPPFKKLIVAVSGGADSMALGYGLKELGVDFVVAHLNHNLRGEESDADARLVQEMAEKWGVKCICEDADIPKEGNLEDNARRIRYAFLEEVRQSEKADFIATAHHFDDQMETILMHMARGAGLRGQIGMRVLSGNIIRPMLEIRRNDILNFIEVSQIPYREDKSNLDLSYDRNFWRHLVIPYLHNTLPDYKERIAEMSMRAKRELDNAEKKAERWIKVNMTEGRFNRALFEKLPQAIQSEILIRLLGAENLYKKTLDRMSTFIRKSQSGSRLRVKDKVLFVEHGAISILSSDDDRNPLRTKTPLTSEPVQWGKWTLSSKSSMPLYAREWKEGDRFQPSGMKGRKKLQDFFVDNKVPRRLRHEIPVIVNSDDAIMAVGNLRVAEGNEDLKRVLTVKTIQ